MRLVIIGAGFAGMYAALARRREHARDAHKPRQLSSRKADQGRPATSASTTRPGGASGSPSIRSLTAAGSEWRSAYKTLL
jgi:succinate dehydrogenase/fumarate reductase flavoprotein subunit